jgi:hypothetical protein
VYSVEPFDPANPANFFRALANDECPQSLVAADHQAIYLLKYLDDVAAATMVIEPEYVDGDYLEDYAAFYVACFHPYDRFCKRIHFFKKKFSRAYFRRRMTGAFDTIEYENFAKSYLGFIVVRPLPQAIIGRTELATYGDDGGRRKYTAIRRYDVSLFGMPLEVESMAFQEQDRVVAACATVALWSCFQKTSTLFGTPSPRPPRVTADATQSMFAKRALPSDGLSSAQICSAIRHNGLEPELFVVPALASEVPLVSLLYGYLSYGLPLLVIASIEGYTQQNHAFTLNGFSIVPTYQGVEILLPPDPVTKAEKTAPIFTGSHISELYAHDDQIGPFAHLFVDPPTLPGQGCTFRGDWTVPGALKQAKITPLHIIVPAYKKIRLSYIDAYKVVTQIRLVVEKMLLRNNVDLSKSEWDLRLTDTNRYKDEVGRARTLPSKRAEFLLSYPQPRYFWQCTLTLFGFRVAEFLIDATEFQKSNPLFCVNYFHDHLRDVFFSDLNPLPTNVRFTPALKEVLLTEYQRTKSLKSR